jgi:hypothetical protein
MEENHCWQKPQWVVTPVKEEEEQPISCKAEALIFQSDG